METVYESLRRDKERERDGRERKEVERERRKVGGREKRKKEWEGGRERESKERERDRERKGRETASLYIFLPSIKLCVTLLQELIDGSSPLHNIKL